MRRGSANGGRPPAPDTPGRERRISRCCAKCRRGVPGYGELPCGYELRCPNRCHEPKTETKENEL